MGNHKFRLSDMIPNAWFYKLKDMGRKRNHNTIRPTKKKQPLTSSSPQPTRPNKPNLSHQRKSYYFTRDLSTPPPPPPPPAALDTTSYNNSHPNPKIFDTHFQEPPRKSSNKRCGSFRRKRASPRPVTSSVSACCSCRTALESVWTKPDSTAQEYPNSAVYSSSDLESLLPEFGSDGSLTTDSFRGTVSWSSSCQCKTNNDIVIDIDNNSFSRKSDRISMIDDLELPPIITKKSTTELVDQKSNEATKFGRKSSKFAKIVTDDKITASKEVKKTSPVRRLSVTSPGVRLRTNSPRIASRKIQGHGRKSVSSSSASRRSLSETFAVVKSSSDPQSDFRESMVEVILENNLRASKDLEELLACYLSLNSDVYHELIIKVFKQIWFDLSNTQLK